MKKYELVIVRINQLKNIESQPWEVYAEGYIKEDDEEGCELPDFCDWYENEEHASQEASLVADYLLVAEQTEKVVMLKAGNEIETRRK